MYKASSTSYLKYQRTRYTPMRPKNNLTWGSMFVMPPIPAPILAAVLLVGADPLSVCPLPVKAAPADPAEPACFLIAFSKPLGGKCGT